MQKKAHIWCEGPVSGDRWSQVRINEDEAREKKEKTRNLCRLFCVVFPKGSLQPKYGHTCPLPLPLSSSPFLTHSLPPLSLAFPLFCNIPSLNVQPVCPSRLSEYATSRLDTLHGRHDQNGPRGDPELRRLPKQINTPRDGHQRAANTDEANRSFEGFFDRWDPCCQNGEGRREGTDDRAASIWNGRKRHTRPGS